MKLNTLLLTTALVASSIAFADAPNSGGKKSSQLDEYYAKIEGGFAMPRKASSFDYKKTGFVGGLGGGYRLNEFFRGDLMLDYRQLKTSKLYGAQATATTTETRSLGMKVTSYSAMLSGYLDAHNDTIFTPYLTGGFGYAQNKASGSKLFLGNYDATTGAATGSHSPSCL